MQKWLAQHYQLIVNVCRSITSEYEDLAHDVILKLPDSVQDVPLCEIKYYIYRVAKNEFIDGKRRKKPTELTFDPQVQEVEPLKDPYEYIQEIRNSNLDELEKLWIDLYLDYEGNYSLIERDMNWKGVGITRQTISKYVKLAIDKLK